MAVVAAAEIQSFTGLPAVEDRAQGRDQLGHALDRIVERGTESPFDLGADLGAQAEGESATGQQLEIVGLVGQMDRVAGEGDGHVGEQIESADGRGQRQRGEHVVRTFEGEHPRHPRRTECPRPLGAVGEAVDRRVHPHRTTTPPTATADCNAFQFGRECSIRDALI
ncbi:Uncharacterised protein [Mycobacteroides abscessus subsp. abscessus]|nr:Uncharacterised protein [Mycobacteroides abscessus subsp. abscessus]